MEPNAIRFFLATVHPEEIQNKKLIDVGSRLIDISLKSIIKSHWYNPIEYIGIDIILGEDVDKICGAEDIVKTFGENRFEFVLCTEVLEHAENWRSVISNLKRCCIPNGIIFVTTRTYTCIENLKDTVCTWPKHDFPKDYWRYNVEDMKTIFSDCIIENLGNDEGPEYLMHRKGIFVKIRKPENFVENDLSNYKVCTLI